MAAMGALLLLSTQVTEAGKFGTAQEARAMLDRAVAAIKQDKTKALAMSNSGEGGFKDRDLYVLSANASDESLPLHQRGQPQKLSIRREGDGNCNRGNGA